ncbi:MAG: sensor histidine kinase [Bacteroidetes bacterium]|nr:sensor histidine kinase [Bacteroidota bacterium]
MTSINFRSRPVTILLHIFIWIDIFFLPVFLLPHPPGRNFFPQFEVSNILFNLLSITLFYINAHFLIPRYFTKKHWGTYLLIMLSSLTIIITMVIWVRNLTENPGFFNRPRPWDFLIFPSLLFWSMSTVYGSVITYSKRQREAETEKLKTELLFLRSQINPHFMFNTLNNLVSLARKRSEQLEPSLLKLSGLLQYMIYESNCEKVSLRQEIDYLKNYIDLQRLRFGNEVMIRSDLAENIDESVEIPPMLFIPFIENAFKHGIILNDPPEINISLTILHHTISLIVSNTFNPLGNETNDQTPGIGLPNAKRRLDLLFPDKHELVINREGHWYTINLTLQYD